MRTSLIVFLTLVTALATARYMDTKPDPRTGFFNAMFFCQSIDDAGGITAAAAIK